MNPVNIPKIKIGILDYSSFVGVSASVERAMNITADTLRKLGYNVVPIKFKDEIWDGMRKIQFGFN